MATVRLSTKNKATITIPAKIATMRIAIRTANQWIEQGTVGSVNCQEKLC